MLRFNTLYSIIEKTHIPVSFKGLIDRCPTALAAYREICEREQAYEALVEGFPEELKSFDKQFAFFVQYDEDKKATPYSIERKDYFTEEEYIIICRNFGIDIEEIRQILADKQIETAPLEPEE